jgi:hypothetical protein
MTAALESAESPPVQDTQVSDEGAAATTALPDAQATEPGSVSDKAGGKKGPIPFDTHETALANARTKEAERVRQEVEQQYSQFKGVTAEELAGYRVIQAALAGSPQAVAQVKGNPQAVAALRALVAEQQQAADPEPAVIGRNPDGTEYFDPDAFEQWKVWNARQTDARVEAKLRPFQQVAQSFQKREAMSQADAEVRGALAEFSSDPDFTKHKADVAAVIANDKQLSALADSDTKAALEIAWGRVYRTKVLPAQQAEAAKTADADALTTIQKRAVAAVGVNPSSATTSTPRRPKSLTEALAMQG